MGCLSRGRRVCSDLYVAALPVISPLLSFCDCVVIDPYLRLGLGSSSGVSTDTVRSAYWREALATNTDVTRNWTAKEHADFFTLIRSYECVLVRII